MFFYLFQKNVLCTNVHFQPYIYKRTHERATTSTYLLLFLPKKNKLIAFRSGNKASPQIRNNNKKKNAKDNTLEKKYKPKPLYANLTHSFYKQQISSFSMYQHIITWCALYLRFFFFIAQASFKHALDHHNIPMYVVHCAATYHAQHHHHHTSG